MGKISNQLLHFPAYLFTENVLQKNAGNGISETLNLKLFWRVGPQTPPRLGRIHRHNYSPHMQTPSGYLHHYETCLSSIVRW